MGSSFGRRAGYIILSEESMQRSGAWLVRAGEPFRFPGEDIFLGKKIRPSALPAPLFRSPAMNTLTPVQFGCIVVFTCSGLPYLSQAWMTLRAEVAPANSLFSFFRGHLVVLTCFLSAFADLAHYITPRFFLASCPPLLRRWFLLPPDEQEVPHGDGYSDQVHHPSHRRRAW